jgi:putative SOS response-associated peptidase YedK
MCGRFTSLLSPELLAVIRETFGVPVPESTDPRYNIAPTQLVRVLRNEGDHNRFDLMKWGLVPFWAKDPSIGSQMINARSETVREKPAFRQAIKYRRCIIPSSGFYEWQRTENRKQPYFIHMAANEKVAPIHDRMPVILHPGTYNFWLSHSMHDPDQLQDMFQAIPSSLIDAYKVSDLVNNARFDAPACIATV